MQDFVLDWWATDYKSFMMNAKMYTLFIVLIEMISLVIERWAKWLRKNLSKIFFIALTVIKTSKQ